MSSHWFLLVPGEGEDGILVTDAGGATSIVTQIQHVFWAHRAQQQQQHAHCFNIDSMFEYVIEVHELKRNSVAA